MTAHQRLFDRDNIRVAGFSGRDFLRVIFKHIWIVSICFIVVGLLTCYGALRQPKLYTATAQVLVKTDQQGAPSFLSGVSAYREAQVQESPNRRIETEMSLMLNRSSIEAVIRKHSLTPALLKRSVLDIVIEPLKPAITNVSEQIRNLFGLEKDQDLSFDAMAATVKAFGNSVAIEPVQSKGAQDSSNVIEVRLTGTDPLITQAVLTSLLQQYVARSAAGDRALGEQALAALNTQTDQAKAELAKSAADIVAYVTGSEARYLSSDNLVSVGTVGATGTKEGEGSSDKRNAVGSNQVASSITAKLRAEIEEQQIKVDTLSAAYTDDYEAVVTARRQLQKLRARVQTESRSTTLAQANLGMLERKRGLAQARYVELQHKLDQISLYLQLLPVEVQGRLVTELPRLAVKESSIKKILLLLFGPIAGLLLGLALATLREFADRRLQSREAVERYLGFETLASLPLFDGVLPVRVAEAPALATLTDQVEL
jgi:uncharacterized protein involved in exopolysaccharide biosynthesis